MKKYFSFSGRARRTEYWLVYSVVTILGYVLDALAEYAEGTLSALLFVLGTILIIWIGFAAGARRCHDLGHNGFWQFIPFYGIWMGFVNGQPGPNEYGENPKGE